MKAQQYTSKTAKYYANYADYYCTWLTSKQLVIATTNYNVLLDYIGFLRLSKSNTMVNQHIRAIALFYEFLKLPNFANGVQLKSDKKDVKLYLTDKELNSIYTNYTAKYKLMLGLIIFQNLASKELIHLKLVDIDLDKGTLYVASGKYVKNSRILPLAAHQIIPLHHYITDRKTTGEYLFINTLKQAYKIEKQRVQIHKALVKQTQDSAINYQSLQQLQQSRIVSWIKQYGLRKAQYLSGHKSILSIERYQNQDIQDLAKQIKKLHPLG